MEKIAIDIRLSADRLFAFDSASVYPADAIFVPLGVQQCAPPLRTANRNLSQQTENNNLSQSQAYTARTNSRPITPSSALSRTAAHSAGALTALTDQSTSTQTHVGSRLNYEQTFPLQTSAAASVTTCPGTGTGSGSTAGSQPLYAAQLSNPLTVELGSTPTSSSPSAPPSSQSKLSPSVTGNDDANSSVENASNNAADASTVIRTGLITQDDCDTRFTKRLSIALVNHAPKLSTLFTRNNTDGYDQREAPHTAEVMSTAVRLGSGAHSRSISSPAQPTNSLATITEDLLECRRLLIEHGVTSLWNKCATITHNECCPLPLEDDANAPPPASAAPPASSSATSSSMSNSDPQTVVAPSTTQSPACLKNTLKLLGRGKTETALALKSDNVTMNVLRNVFWSFSRIPLKRSLTNITNIKREADALQMFDGILSFSGIKTKVSRQVNMVDRYEVVQLLIKKCLESEELCNEFYLQLIKQTTDNPESGGPISLANWHLLTIVCGIIPPPHHLIARYLGAHLRKMAIVKQFIDESRLAQRCARLQASLSDKPSRKCPPSCKEIMSVTNKKPMHEKVFLLDGRIVLIELHPHVTAHQICAHVKSSVGMRPSAKHFALYELHHTYERAMQPDTYLCDSLFVWEQYAKKHRTVRAVRYMMKKKLFIEPILNMNDHVEVELVYSQLINEVFEGRIPVSMDSVISLCALIAQAEVGDYNAAAVNLSEIEKAGEKSNETTSEDGKPLFDYRTTTRILPRDLRERVRLIDIAEKHQKFTGMKVIDTRMESISLIKSWNLFGAGLFRVTQENSILTRSFILAVNSAGIHFLSGSVSQGNLSLTAPFATYPFSHIVCLAPELESLALTVRGQTRELEKNVFRTAQAYQIVDLITDYMNELRLSNSNYSEPLRRRSNRTSVTSPQSSRKSRRSRRGKTPDKDSVAAQSAIELNGNGNGNGNGDTNVDRSGDGNGNGNIRFSRKNRVATGSTSTSSNSEILSQTHSTPT